MHRTKARPVRVRQAVSDKERLLCCCISDVTNKSGGRKRMNHIHVVASIKLAALVFSVAEVIPRRRIAKFEKVLKSWVKRFPVRIALSWLIASLLLYAFFLRYPVGTFIFLGTAGRLAIGLVVLLTIVLSPRKEGEFISTAPIISISAALAPLLLGWIAGSERIDHWYEAQRNVQVFGWYPFEYLLSSTGSFSNDVAYGLDNFYNFVPRFFIHSQPLGIAIYWYLGVILLAWLMIAILVAVCGTFGVLALLAVSLRCVIYPIDFLRRTLDLETKGTFPLLGFFMMLFADTFETLGQLLGAVGKE